ncbi:MAG: hypothetical protein N3G18_02730 [Candidatus Saccharicenans sp.]|nr:hypothetical protein [Candidatus Saccharicenans sp.]
MRPKSWISFALGAFLFILGIWSLAAYRALGSVVPLLIGGSLVYLSWTGSRTATLVFGHATIVVGCFLVTWGIYLLPQSEPTFAHILGRPLFWGFISIFGGICANYHGFCACVRRKSSGA